MPTPSPSPRVVYLSRRALRRPRPPPHRCDAQPEAVRYAECRRNHAAAAGGHVVDGCMEFMPSGPPGSAGALSCAACGCHRSFHLRQVVRDRCPAASTTPR